MVLEAVKIIIWQLFYLDTFVKDISVNVKIFTDFINRQRALLFHFSAPVILWDDLKMGLGNSVALPHLKNTIKAYLTGINWTLLFWACPSGVSLLAVGRANPKPLVESPLGSIPLLLSLLHEANCYFYPAILTTPFISIVGCNRINTAKPEQNDAINIDVALLL